MRPISAKNRKLIEEDDFFKTSFLSGKKATPSDRIVIHHCFVYAGRQIDDIWNLIPLLNSEHDYNFDKSVHSDHVIKKYVEYLTLARADMDEIQKKYYKRDWHFELKKLRKEFDDFCYNNYIK